MKKNGYRMIFEAFIKAGKTAHLSPGAAFALSADGSSYHEFTLDNYMVGSPEETVPRLSINYLRGHKGLPLSVSAKWRIEPRAPSRFFPIEISLLEDQLEAAFAHLPRLIDHLEAGHNEGFEAFLPFPCVVKPTKTNIWSKTADDVATAINRAREARRQARLRRATAASSA